MVPNLSEEDRELLAITKQVENYKNAKDERMAPYVRNGICFPFQFVKYHLCIKPVVKELESYHECREKRIANNEPNWI